MKSVLISIQPKWVEKICSGEKIIEVRKTRPKIETPFKCYIYCTQTKTIGDIILCKSEENAKLFGFNTVKGINKGFAEKEDIKLKGKVIGEFVCDNILHSNENAFIGNKPLTQYVLRSSCLTMEEINRYRQDENIYAWHITDLKIYDKPKELSEFYPIKPKRVAKWTDKDACAFCKYHRWGNTPFEETCLLDKPEPICEYTPPLTRPPQSWCYVESLGE